MKIGLQRALKASGGPAALARWLGITKQAVGQWDRVPAERVLAVSDATGVPCHVLRPDLHRAPAVVGQRQKLRPKAPETGSGLLAGVEGN